jgi:hypothetical protein
MSFTIYLILFTHATPRTKSKRLLMMSLNIYLMLFIRAAPRTKSMRHPIDVP